jgi:hypothetical protein
MFHGGQRIAAALTTTVALVACVPMPVPSHSVMGSRENLGVSMPGAIVEGKSTREDVLLALGEPDRRGIDDRWFTYESAHSLGGVAIVLVPPGYAEPAVLATREAMRYRVVVVRFDLQGVVTSARFAEHVCREWMPGSKEPYRCVDLAGLEPISYGQATLPSVAGETLRESFIAAAYRRDDRWIDGAAFVTNQAVYVLDREARGEPINRLVFRWSTAEIVEIDWDKLDAAAGTVRMRHSDGSVERLAFKRLPLGSDDPLTFDRTRAERFIALVRLVKDPSAR